MRLGFIGTGTITAHIVRGLQGSALADWPVVLSPRNAETATALATLPGVTIAASNQAVVEACDIVILAVRPQIAHDVLSGLRIGPDQLVISLIAGLHLPQIAALTGAARIARAIPLPFVEQRQGVTPVYPADPIALRLFAALGTALPVGDLAAYDAYAAASALMGSYFGILQTAQGWMVGQGLPDEAAASYLRGLFGSLGDVLRASDADFASLRADHSTRGGLNEMVFDHFAKAGATEALEAALTAAFNRVQGRAG